MEFWQRVHWFATSKCNQRCMFCFKPDFKSEDSPSITGTLAKTLADNGIKEVIFTGGEPLLLKSLDYGLNILAEKGVDVSIHTNTMLLNRERLESLVGLVDEIAIPLDSMDRYTQKYLRGQDCLAQLTRTFDQLQDKPVRIGIHTVATEENIQHIPQIYKFLKKGRFDYWRIYEYNQNLVADRLKSVRNFLDSQILVGEGATESDGGVHTLFADFLLMEERMAKFKDTRVQFVGVSDYNRAPYFFLDTKGDAYFCTYFLQGKRRLIGNVLKEGFERVRDKAIEADKEGPLLDEEAFIETENNSPLWARAAWNGNYDSEDLEEVSARYAKKFVHLAELYLSRLKRQGEAPKDAQMTIEVINK